MPMTGAAALAPGPGGPAGVSPLLAGQGKVNLQQLPQLAEEAESLFLTQLIQQMRQAMVTSVRGRRQEMKEYQVIVDQEVARALAVGGGLGLARKIYEDLAPRLAGQGKEAQHGITSRVAEPGEAGSSPDTPVPEASRVPGTGEAGPDPGR